MNPATSPAARDRRLLHLDPRSGELRDRHVRDLPRLVRPADVVVVNDAATLPASFAGRTADGQELEVRLAGANEDGTWSAVLLGPGDWRQRTEDRPAPPTLAIGTQIAFGPGLAARVTEVSALSSRLVSLAFGSAGSTLWSALYRLGRPVQYSYLRAALALWDVQPFFASRPWAYEPASAGLALSAQVMDGLRGAGAIIASVTHAAGLSSTGDPAIDAALPLRERYDVPEADRAGGARGARGGRPGHRGGNDGRARAGRRGRGRRRTAGGPHGMDRDPHRRRVPPADRRRVVHRSPPARRDPLRAAPGLCPRRRALGGARSRRPARAISATSSATRWLSYDNQP